MRGGGLVHGVGVEIIRIERFARALDRHGDKLLKRLFADEELKYCLSKRRPELHLAARFAAKVSLRKALGFSLGFQDIEVVRSPGGAPLFGAAGLDETLTPSLSITHTPEVAMAATVVLRS